jgi:hypothetical protein
MYGMMVVLKVTDNHKTKDKNMNTLVASRNIGPAESETPEQSRAECQVGARRNFFDICIGRPVISTVPSGETTDPTKLGVGDVVFEYRNNFVKNEGATPSKVIITKLKVVDAPSVLILLNRHEIQNQQATVEEYFRTHEMYWDGEVIDRLNKAKEKGKNLYGQLVKLEVVESYWDSPKTLTVKRSRTPYQHINESDVK